MSRELGPVNCRRIRAVGSAQDNGQEASEPKAPLVQALKKIARPSRTFDQTGQ